MPGWPGPFRKALFQQVAACSPYSPHSSSGMPGIEDVTETPKMELAPSVKGVCSVYSTDSQAALGYSAERQSELAF